ncbi:MAG: hypothetical protein JW720_01165, partial [Sedimentisphaerales bacterium]|nr:hypothetical protein [Sedimentisphaerales bacterium]
MCRQERNCKASIGILGMVFLISGGSFLQGELLAAADDFKPASTNQPGRPYPQVNSEGCVRACLVAPEAQNVLLDIGGVKYPMTKDEEGAWIGDSQPQDEGFHYYQLVVDGAQVPDPGSKFFYGASRWGSGVEIPAKDQDIYAFKDVPHGQLREIHYFSKTTNIVRRVYIYTPPGYDTDIARRYPVLYLQHGMGENETGWGNQGHAHLIMDNLIAAGKARPFLIVMENGEISFGGARRGASRPAAAPGRGADPASAAASGPGTVAPAGDANPPRRTAGGPMRGFNVAGQFERILIDDLIPYVEANFRVIPDQAHRAMAGLSMGGMQTRSIVIANPDKFSHIGMFSSGTISPSEIADIDIFKKNVKVVFMSFGEREGGAFRIQGAADKWNQAGIKGVSYISPETAHEWQSWRRSLHQFAQLLFSDLNENSAAAAKIDGLRIFSAGHSLHWYVPDILTELALASGIEGHKKVGVQSLGVSRTIQHWEHEGGRNEARRVLEQSKVDVLTLSPIQFPDEGIDNFVKLGLEHNPNMKFTVQISWGGPDIDNQDFSFAALGSRPDREKTPEQLKTLNDKNVKAGEAYASKINEQYGRQVVLLVPASQALAALRTMIYNKEIPGLNKQAELFADNIGHPTPPLEALNAYLHYAVIYGR